ncbi:hypothetical protein CWT02_0147 [Salmonella enterica subsp. enterica serovar Cubana]|nr:hypothetical protein CWT02_0147 [Salmonella enterica subsp. enterica serovar Cubana]
MSTLPGDALMALTNKVLRQELRRLHVVRPNGIRIIKIAGA